MQQDIENVTIWPNWVPEITRRYLAHTEAGISIRALAREAECHASTIMRQIRRVEAQREDPLIDAALQRLGETWLKMRKKSRSPSFRKGFEMSAIPDQITHPETDTEVPEHMRILRRLSERDAVLAVAADMEKAVVVRESAKGNHQRLAVTDRVIAEALAVQGWIATQSSGRLTRYRITAAGRAALEAILDTPQTDDVSNGFAEVHRIWGEKVLPDPETHRMRRFRYNLSESPLTALARRRDKDGKRFLSDNLVAAGERLREDFELAQMGTRVAQNWDRFLTNGTRGGSVPDGGVATGPEGARRRFAAALDALGPGLGDVALRCCCYLEGLETAEKRLGWSARSGKIVLRIALVQLNRHYEEVNAAGGGLIG